MVFDDVEVYEYVPRRYWRWRVGGPAPRTEFRRLAEAKTMAYFKPVLYAEAYLHLVNPWLVPAAFAAAVAAGPPGWALAALGLALLPAPPTGLGRPCRFTGAVIRSMWDRQLV
ncbi:hypothetical protein [Pyrobaculum ferrireducens]|uniref:Uncharacterized protein n=1 Tax=Pyrobaculum ferrireducens TaxID=1104324 RepID=G7VIE8_9CREN|nr:hypothetical protein [Pyrobaculum ferrireducens]AET33428.1 hypothetical protein P186_2032 [Pyrobaculum ferrireducens]